MSLKEWAFGGVKRSCDIELINALFYKKSHVYQNLIFCIIRITDLFSNQREDAKYIFILAAIAVSRIMALNWKNVIKILIMYYIFVLSF